MKRKILLLILVLFLISILTGCGVTPPPPGASAEDMAKEAVYHYWEAIINRQYELARWYCVSDGVWYNKVDEWEEYININSEGKASLLIYYPNFYKTTEVIGEDIYEPDIRDEAIAYVEIFTDITAFPGNYLHEGDTFIYEIELHKQNYPPGDWELK